MVKEFVHNNLRGLFANPNSVRSCILLLIPLAPLKRGNKRDPPYLRAVGESHSTDLHNKLV